MTDIAFTARAGERSDFTRGNRHVFERFSNKDDDSGIGGRRPGSWLNGGVSGPALAQVRCFLGGLGLVW